MPPSGGGRRAFFRPLTVLPRRLRPGVPPCTLRCPCAPCGVLRALRYSVCSGVRPMPALWCPCALCGVLRALGLPYTLRVALRASRSLAAHHAPQYRARLSPASQQLSPPPSGGPLPRPAAALSPAQRRSSAPPRRTAEKKPGRSKRSGRALFISLSGDEAQRSDQA